MAQDPGGDHGAETRARTELKISLPQRRRRRRTLTILSPQGPPGYLAAPLHLPISAPRWRLKGAMRIGQTNFLSNMKKSEAKTVHWEYIYANFIEIYCK